jgi:glycosyltransferase involved in cell wall biosynthesis
MTAALHTARAAAAYDILHVEHLRAALYGSALNGLPRVYDAVDCMSRLLAQTAAAGPTPLSRLTARAEQRRTSRFEQSLLRRFDRILLTAESERDAWLANTAAADRAAARDRVAVLPNGVDLDYFAPADVARDRATLVFVGRMAYHANRAAAHRLLDEILPSVWARRPEARLLIVGADPPPALRALAERAGSRVEITGSVGDVRPYLARATVSVSPLAYAVGIQNKVLEAMAMATPAVATPAACAGLRAVANRDLLVAADAGDIAASIVRLLDDAALAQTVGAAGRRYVEAQHDWHAVVRELEAVYGDVIETFAARAHAGAGAA